MRFRLFYSNICAVAFGVRIVSNFVKKKTQKNPSAFSKRDMSTLRSMLTVMLIVDDYEQIGRGKKSRSVIERMT